MGVEDLIGDADLVVFPGRIVAETGLAKPLQSRLAYHVRNLLEGLFIDAINGEILYRYATMQGANIVSEGAGRTIVEYPTFPEVARDGVVTSPGAALSADAAAGSAFLDATDVFYRAHGWLGSDGTGGDLNVNVNVNMFTCPNAFAPFIINETFFCTGDAVPDVVGHELTHLVIWSSSNLTYADESGSLNESYGDVMGNLAFPDAAVGGGAPGWLVSELAPGGPVRDMANPVVTNYSLYRSRTDVGCPAADAPGLTCDFGGVHTNSGITNLAHVMMSDGSLAGLNGMGRAKLRMIAFDSMTRRLSPFSRLIDAALASVASCQMHLDGGIADMTGAAFAQLDCDQVAPAFRLVGLDPDLMSGWAPTVAGFSGATVFHAGETTDSACPIGDLTLQLNTPSGLLESQASLVPGGAPLSVNYLGLATASIAATAPPIGTATKTHTVAWTSAFGETPQFSTAIIEVIPGGALDCRNPPPGAGGAVVLSETKRSGIATGAAFPLVPSAGTVVVGNAASTMNTACALVNTEVEIVDGTGAAIAGPGATATWSDTVWVFGLPVTFTRTATVATPPAVAPPGAGGNFDLSATVGWTYSAGLVDTRVRLVYLIDKPAGTTCDSLNARVAGREKF